MNEQLRAAAEWVSRDGRAIDHWGGLRWQISDEAFSALRQALAATPEPGIDVERLARAIEAAGGAPACGDCGAEISHHAECDEGDGALVWEINTEAVVAEYARLASEDR